MLAGLTAPLERRSTCVVLDDVRPARAVDRPFTRTEARRAGGAAASRRVVPAGLLAIRPGVYHAAQLPGRHRPAARLPPAGRAGGRRGHATGRPAGCTAPRMVARARTTTSSSRGVSMSVAAGYRLRNGLAASGERACLGDEVVELGAGCG